MLSGNVSSGGISLKPAAGMSTMKADMSGAGCVASSIMGLGASLFRCCPNQLSAKMEVNTRVVGLIPLCENMPSSSALKPGDVLIASDGTSVEVLGERMCPLLNSERLTILMLKVD